MPKNKQRTLTFSPNSNPFVFGYAILLKNDKQYEKALTDEVKKSTRHLLSKMKLMMGILMYFYGNCYFGLRKMDQAIPFFRQSSSCIYIYTSAEACIGIADCLFLKMEYEYCLAEPNFWIEITRKCFWQYKRWVLIEMQENKDYVWNIWAKV